MKAVGIDFYSGSEISRWLQLGWQEVDLVR
jgi:hypothetical protein